MALANPFRGSIGNTSRQPQEQDPGHPPGAPVSLAAMRHMLLVAAGGAVGSVARHLVGRALAAVPGGYPWGTLVVNVAGAFVLGAVLARWPAPDADARALLGVGLCGGFTTFSALAAELTALPPARAGAYAAASLVLGVASVLAGRALVLR